MRSFFITLIVIALSFSIQAQDIHFSQFYAAPLDLNPAMTGVMKCKMRFSANYRNQWAPILKSNAYNTYMFSYDQKVPVGRYDYFGFGANFWGDKAGALGFGTVQFRASAAYSKRLGGDRTSSHYLVFGANGGLNQRSINFQNAQYGSQHDGKGGWDSNGPIDPSQLNVNDRFLFADVAVGALWYSILNRHNSFWAGVAMNHLNQANVSFYRADVVPLYSKFTFHAGGEFRMSRQMYIVPGVVFFNQGPSWETNAGTSLRFNLTKSRFEEQSFDIGLWARVSNGEEKPTFDAIILSTRFDYNKFGLGFTYDINTSSLRQANAANGSFELSLVYVICGPERRGVYCPNF